MVLIIMFAVGVLIATAVGVALSQQVASGRTMQRTDALEVTQAGLDIAIGQIRSAVNGSSGDVVDLPCTGSFTVDSVSAGGFQVNGKTSGGSATYAATVTYWAGQQPTAYNITQGNATGVACYGTSYPDAVPNYALVTSTGQGSATSASRQVQEIYAFENDDLNMPGGLIGDFVAFPNPNQAPDDLCIVAASGPSDDTGTFAASVGTSLYVNYCQGGTIDFTWQYTSNFQLELSNTGLCIQPNDGNGSVSLQSCLLATNPNLYQQQWGIDDAGDYEPATAAGGATGYCLAEDAATPTAGAKLVVTTTDLAGHGCDSMDDTMTWDPTPQVGDGDAGAGTTDQLVSYGAFGNCLDDTNWGLPYTYLITFMCKQFPDGVQAGDTSDPGWNQRWYSVPVTYHDTQNNTTYTNYSEYMLNTGSAYWCLWSPLNNSQGLINAYPNNNVSWANIEVCPVHVAGSAMPSLASSQNFLWQYTGSPTYQLLDFSTNGTSDCLATDKLDSRVPAGGSAFYTVTVAACSPTNAYEEWNGVSFYKTPGASDQLEPNVNGN